MFNEDLKLLSMLVELPTSLQDKLCKISQKELILIRSEFLWEFALELLLLTSLL
jgi:hypothetical protein